MEKTIETTTFSAFSYDYSDKAYKLMYANNQFEFVPKSQVKFLESQKKGELFDDGGSNYFEAPVWLVRKLKGLDFYGF